MIMHLNDAPIGPEFPTRPGHPNATPVMCALKSNSATLTLWSLDRGNPGYRNTVQFLTNGHCFVLSCVTLLPLCECT